MTIQETLGALGSWDIDLKPTIPREALDALVFFGHIAIVPGRVDPAVYGDSLLDPAVARYVGVLRGNSLADDARTNAPNDNVKISGVGLSFWLGDEDNKGSIIENATTFASGSTFPNVIRGLLPASGAVTEGTLHSVPGTYSGTHQWQTPAQAIQYVCDTMATPSAPVSWRVNTNGTLDAGLNSDLFVTTPQCAVVARGDGEDMALRGIPGSMNLDSDMKDFTTRVVLLAEGDGASIATGSANIAPGSNPYKDLHGNPVKLTRLVSESDTSATNAATRAQLALSQFEGPTQDLQLGIQDYDVDGAFNVGDYIYVYDPDKGLVDTGQEIIFRGQRLNPITLQVVGIQWPVTADYTVAYRSANGTWLDLTDHIEINDAGTYVTVGDFKRQLTGGSTEPVGSRPSQDTSVPGVPVLVTPFQGAAYLDSRGFTRARVRLQWTAPLNVDGSTILDGDHYDIRYAVDTDMIYPATWSAVSQIRWQDMQSWAQPFAAPDDGWQTMVVGWDQATAQVQDLSPGVGYDVQIRAVDSSGNVGAWSPTTTFVATQDNIAPSTPAAPTVAASRIAVQITHLLGKASGGDFTLESDLDHLEIHAQYEPAFTPDDTTLLGKLKANAGMIQAQIPAVGTYSVESTAAIYVRVVAVDIAGNRSGPSTAVTATALLIDDAHISDLTVSKVTAGTITASWVMAGEIKTADTGARMRISGSGFELYDATGTQTMFGSTADGSLSMIGQLSTSSSGRRIIMNPSSLPEIRFYADSGTDYSYINAFTVSTLTGIGMNGANYSSGGNTLGNRVVVYPNGNGVISQSIKASSQSTQGGETIVWPGGVDASYKDDGVTTGGKMDLQATLGQIGFRIGDSNESYSKYYDSTTATFGNLASQQQATQTQVMLSVSVGTGVGTLGRSFDITYPSRPYAAAAFTMGGSGSVWYFNSISATSFAVFRNTTTGSAVIDALFTRTV
ncbi:fibronectin type III domain-containing protein [Streptomyces sp. NBC_00433]